MKKFIKSLNIFLLVLSLLIPSMANPVYGQEDDFEEISPEEDEFIAQIEEKAVAINEDPNVPFLVDLADWDFKTKDFGLYLEGFKDRETAKSYLSENKGVLKIPKEINGYKIYSLSWDPEYLYLDIEGIYLKKIVLPDDGYFNRFYYSPQGPDFLEEIVFKPQKSTVLEFLFPDSNYIRGLSLKKKDFNPEGRIRLQAGKSFYLNKPDIGREDTTEETIKDFINNMSYRRVIYNPKEGFVDKDKEYFKILDNPVRLKIKCQKEDGSPLKEDIIQVGWDRHPSEIIKKDDKYVFSTREEAVANPRPLRDYASFPYKEDFKKEDVDALIKGILDKANKLPDSSLYTHINFAISDISRKKPNDSYFELNQDKSETITPPYIDGYESPKPQVINFKYDGNENLYTRNDKDLVWERELVFTYKESTGKTHTVTLKVDGEKNQELKVKHGAVITKPSEPSKEGHQFKGWFKEGETRPWEFSTPVDKDMTLVAKFEKNSPKSFAVKFQVDSQVINEESVEEGKTLAKPTNPTKDGYEFKGWYKGDKEWDFSEPIKEDMTLVAKFAKKEDTKPPQDKVDKTILNFLYDDYKNKKAEDYTDKTWSAFKEALNQAKLVINNDKASQDQVNKAATNLQKAAGGLIGKVDKPGLKVEKIESFDKLKLPVGTKEDEVKDKLPKFIRIYASNGKVYYAPITWTIYNYNKDYPGTYDAKGDYKYPKALDKDEKEANVFTQVILEGKAKGEFKSFGSLSKIIVEKGTMPNLPKTVRVNYKDGSSKVLNVSWDLKNFDKNKLGTYLIQGKVEGLDQKASQIVQVEEKKDVKNNKGQGTIYLRDTFGHWAENAIKWTVKNGLFYGNDRQEFEPNRTISRGEFMAVLFRVTGENPEKYRNKHFDDVHKGEYFEPAVEWGRRNNVVTGYEDGLFHPDDRLTREQQATILYRFNNVMNFKFEGRATRDFKDEGKIGDWARQAVKTLQAQGLMQGDENSYFKPKAKITRAEVAQILYNMNNKVLSTYSGNKTNKKASDEVSKGTNQKNQAQDSTSTNTGGILGRKQGNYTPLPSYPSGNQSSTGSTDKAQVTFSIDALTTLDKLERLPERIRYIVPTSGYFVRPVKVNINPGETVWDVTKRVSNEEGINLDYEFTEQFNSVYIKAINGLGQFDAGENSGWMYNINGIYPNRGASIVKLQDGDTIQWRYTSEKGDLTSGLSPVPDRI